MNKDTLAYFCERMKKEGFCSGEYCDDECRAVRLINFDGIVRQGFKCNEAWEILHKEG